MRVDSLVDALKFVQGPIRSFGRERDLIHRLVCVGQREGRVLYGEARRCVHQGEDIALQLDDSGIREFAARREGVQANLTDLHRDVVEPLRQGLHLVVRECCSGQRDGSWLLHGWGCCSHGWFDLD
jgi:hypothetical protein